MNGTDTVRLLTLELARLLDPVGRALATPAGLDGFLRTFGYRLDDAELAQVFAGLGATRDVLAELADLVSDLTALPESSEDDLAAVVAKVPAATAAVRDLPAALAVLADRLTPTFTAEVFDQLVATYLVNHHGAIHGLSVLIGLVDYRHVPAGGGDPDARDIDYRRAEVRWDRLAGMLGDPVGPLRDGYGWATAAFGANLLLVRAQSVALAAGVPADVTDVDSAVLPVLWPAGAPTDPPMALRVPVWWDNDTDDPAVDAWAEAGLILAQAGPTALAAADSGLALQPYAEGGVAATVPLSDRVDLEVVGVAQLAGGPVFLVRPGSFALTGTGPVPGEDTRVGLRLRRKPGPDEDAVTLVSAGLVSVTASSVFLELIGTPDGVEVAAGIEGGSLAVGGAGGDGFLAEILPPEGWRVPFDLALSWSSETGLHVRGGAGLDATMPVGATPGPVTFKSVHFGLVPDGGAIHASVSASVAVTLGPFSVSVDRMGARLDLDFPPEGGNLGPARLALGPQPPEGIGLAIDLPAVRGGGFLSLDPVAGRYSGVFELTIVETVAVKAIGIINTKRPDGGPGFALLLVITAAGFTPIPLGMGFTLTGIGGLVALNRTIDADAIRAGLSGGVLDSLLFADDPVRNADRIVDTLDRFFPQAPDRLLVGPLAEISWGSPPIVKIRLALLLELPQPIRAVLLAAISVVLPDAHKPVVELYVDAIGSLDLTRRELALDAALHHSRLASFALSGEMAVRLNFGDEPTFLVSIGGFHPRFEPPAGLRRLERLTISLSGSDNPRIRFESYLALTANTIQMGARVSLRAEAGGFGLDGGGAFDALMRWAPFGVDLSFLAWVRVFGPTGTLVAARLAVDVTGPQPWRVAGVLTVQVLWFSVDVSVNLTVGTPGPPPRWNGWTWPAWCGRRSAARRAGPPRCRPGCRRA
ncbi:hypothetical protein Pflav_047750 [Phytohabitans flavus]|uniref:DUF6603 domain-containing protein n=1 Tax=Phytohabitans flavus TaxID=1076124 RepID=A0A6F8XX09_9ACTN|nr:DUF6603 domain-containing protein [Phytohabitans flavus]BCB78365.1 hypothetical protein Pflav_047750 [Phytohabitans flavus]